MADRAGQGGGRALEFALVGLDLVVVVVDGRVAAGDQIGVDHVPEDQVAVEVEEVFLVVVNIISPLITV